MALRRFSYEELPDDAAGRWDSVAISDITQFDPDSAYDTRPLTPPPPPPPPKTIGFQGTPVKPLVDITAHYEPREKKPQKSPHTGHWQRGWDRFGSWWAWEVICIVVGTACLLAVVAICRNLDGQSSDYWHSSISPNAMISTLTTIAKGAVLFSVAASMSQLKWLYFQSHPRRLADIDVYNEATTSPVAAVQFLFKIKGHALLASAAAFIVIIALLFEPMAQQLLSYRQSPLQDFTRNASIPLAQVYDVGGSYEYGSAIASDAMSGFSVPDKMRIAILDGFFGSANGSMPSTMDLPLSCPSGNCTFDPFTSLGVCSSCRSSTADAEYHFNAPWVEKVDCLVTLRTSVNGDHDPGDSQDCTISTDSGMDVRIYEQVLPEYGPGMVAMNVTSRWYIDNANGTRTRFGLNNGGGGPDDKIVEFLIARADTSILAKPPTPSDPHALHINPIKIKDVTECSLTWCAQTFDTLSIRSSHSTSAQPAWTWPLAYEKNPDFVSSDGDFYGDGYYRPTTGKFYGILSIPNNTGEFFSSSCPSPANTS